MDLSSYGKVPLEVRKDMMDSKDRNILLQILGTD